MRRVREFLALFSKKFFHDALPVALASVLGTLVLTHVMRTDRPQPAAPATAGEEMVKLVHEEHSLIVDFLRQQARKHEADVTAQQMDNAAERAAASHRVAETGAVPLPVPRATAMRLAAEQSRFELARAEAKLAQAAGPQPLTQQVLAQQVLTQQIVPQPVIAQQTVAQQVAAQPAAAPRQHGIRDTMRGIVTGTRDAAATVWNRVAGGLIERVTLPDLPALPDMLPRRDFQARM
jgi:hypothetical protein